MEAARFVMLTVLVLHQIPVPVLVHTLVPIVQVTHVSPLRVTVEQFARVTALAQHPIPAPAQGDTQGHHATVIPALAQAVGVDLSVAVMVHVPLQTFAPVHHHTTDLNAQVSIAME